ncbi:MAG: VOC family protein, partial [Bacteroidota bacterium]
GNQISAHLTENGDSEAPTNHVDGKEVPVKHFGAILEMDEWQALADKLTEYGIEFIIEPYVRFKGEVGEQATMFFLDPNGNAIEFKAFGDKSQIFAS